MTRLRNIVLGGIAALAIGGVAGSAQAMETGTFQNRLNGATIGLPLGALPPAGLYTGLETAYLGPLVGSGNSGASTGNQCARLASGACAALPAIAQAVPLLWVPGWNFLGATYGASVVQAFYNFETCGLPNGGCGGGSPIIGGGFVFTNTFINPITLSWNLGGGWFVSASFNFTPPDGTKANGPAAFSFTPNPDYWTFEPALAISYLGPGWVLSGNFFYDINTQSQGTCCAATKITSGNALYGDLMALWKIGKWEIGPVGYFEVQTTADSGGCTPAPGVSLCGNYSTAAAGALVGYDFGPVDLQVWVTDSFVGQNTPQGPGGINVWTRIGFKLWGPAAPPAPLVAEN